ncbi:MAG: DUF2336 domain-containing protein [Alphaproteobacteria bacterium]|nr:DUF2336 domain-containing protein [Alphaproteobacteria bacterium]
MPKAATASIANMSDLAAMARHADAASRGRLYEAVIRLVRSRGSELTDPERVLMRDILGRLTDHVEKALRQALAEELAEDSGAPVDIILLLAQDEIDVARPVLHKSDVIGGPELADLARRLGEAHQLVIAGRPNLPEEPSQVLAENGIESVVLALLNNVTAQIPVAAFATLARLAEGSARLQGPLVSRTDLPGDIAARIALVVGEDLRQRLIDSGQLSPAEVNAAIARAGTRTPQDAAAPAVLAGDDLGAQRLVEKLHAARQLTPGLLVKALTRNQMTVFEFGLAKLTDLPVTETRRALYERGAECLAALALAIGLDRSIFATLAEACAVRSGRPEIRAYASQPEVARLFERATAKEAFRIIRSATAQ